MFFGKKVKRKCKPCPKKRKCKNNPLKTIKFIIEHSQPDIKEKIEKFINKIPSPPPPPPSGGPKPPSGRSKLPSSESKPPLSFLEELKTKKELKKTEITPKVQNDFIKELKKGVHLKKPQPKKEIEKTYFNPFLKELEEKLKLKHVEFGKRIKKKSEIKYLRYYI